MARIATQNRVAVSNRQAVTQRLQKREFPYSFRTNGARYIDLTSVRDPMSAPFGLSIWMCTPGLTGSNQNIYAQLDGDDPVANAGRIYMMIRTTGALASFFGGNTQTSDLIIQPRRNYMLSMYFDPDAGNLQFFAGDRKRGSFHSSTIIGGVSTEPTDGSHRLFVSKTLGGFLQTARVQRVEFFDQPMTASDFQDVFYQDKNDFTYENRFLLGEGAGVNIASEVNGITGTANSASWTPRTMFKNRVTP